MYRYVELLIVLGQPHDRLLCIHDLQVAIEIDIHVDKVVKMKMCKLGIKTRGIYRTNDEREHKKL